MNLLRNNKKENLSLSFKVKKQRGLFGLFGGRSDDGVSPRTLRALFSRRRTQPIQLDVYRREKARKATNSRSFFHRAA